MKKENFKIFLLTFITLILIACDSKNATDFEDDKNRIISEMIRDTIFINDTTIIIETEIVHDTITDYVYDTIYINKERKLIQLELNGQIQYSETWIKANERKTFNKTYQQNTIAGTFYLDSLVDNVIIHSNMTFTRNEDDIENSTEWLFKLLLNTRFLNFDNETILLPFGQTPGIFHYFTVITTNKNKTNYSKVSQNNILRINFNNKQENSFNMIIEGVLLKEDSDLINPNSYINFSLIIPLKFK